jgi:hypothetical protein
MDTIEQDLINWRASHMASISIGGLLSRNPIAYKWKGPFRCWLLREAAFWRVTDLLTQSYALHRQGHGLGARILLRSGYETLAALIFLNHNIRAVIEGKLDFHEFDNLTVRQVLGAKNVPELPEAVNVLTMLGKADKKYSGLRDKYDSLSESAHPNYEGMLQGYSKVYYKEYETNFSNRWIELYGSQHLNLMKLCMMTFLYEYNDVWVDLMEKFENWIVVNDPILEKSKPSVASS